MTSSVFLIHCKRDRRLAHVDDRMPVVIATTDDEAHELHEVEGLALSCDVCVPI